ncbi:hypothetical protein IDSA_05555 [Pseudidiomarina salinarum]|uniref:Uncharacterized protein n=1 Tax=Pseudidiomarina salinarum TaxID=435908 RepID=A0A094IWR9_9GAMM|nr:hypothetical protein [Pseudidiomarina salinarum]KFZ32130.1 hypothetical protein IDSA_05555 [Pseudidiomarina salinarum]RUO70082.1 hypothetical protein CWI79_01035 [Pseudidiomarina salinarum]
MAFGYERRARGNNDRNVTSPKIAENTSTNISFWVAEIAASAAISGAIVSGLLQFFNELKRSKRAFRLEEKKLRANIIASESLGWLQDIREWLSSVCTHLDMQYSFLKRPGTPPQLQQTLDDYSFSVMQEVHHITLLLKPDKPDHRELKRSLAFKQKIMLKYFIRKSGTLPQIYGRRYTLIENIADNALTSSAAPLGPDQGARLMANKSFKSSPKFCVSAGRATSPRLNKRYTSIVQGIQ